MTRARSPDNILAIKDQRERSSYRLWLAVKDDSCRFRDPLVDGINIDREQHDEIRTDKTIYKKL